MPASVDRHKHRVATLPYITPYIYEQTGLEMLKIAAVSAWFAGHILSILVKGSLSISAIG